jgi:hypothetical protein
MKKTVLGALILSSLAAGTARAQNLADQINSTTFGNPGQVAISSDFAIDFRHANGASRLELAPAVDYFLAPQLSLGGQVVFAYASFKGGGSESTFGLGPRVGYNIPLAPMFSLYPRAGLSFSHNTATGRTSSNLLGIFLFAPFLFHPVPHFFLGLGPSIGGDFAGGSDAQHFVEIGILSTVGGYFDW